MIDWANVGWSALWILGLSLELAVLSIAYDRSSESLGERRQKLGQVLGERGFQLAINLGMVFSCLGLAALANNLWQRLAWGLLCAGFTVSLGCCLLKKRQGDSK